MGHHIFGLGALNGHGRDIRLADLDIQAPLGGDGLRPKPDVAIGNRQPKQIIGQFQADRIVDQNAVMVAKRHIFALPHLLARQITWRQNLRQNRGIGAFQLHLPLHRHIPLADPVDQAPIFGLRVAIRGGHQHVVIGGKGCHAFGHGGIEKGRGPQAGRGADRKHVMLRLLGKRWGKWAADLRLRHCLGFRQTTDFGPKPQSVE